MPLVVMIALAGFVGSAILGLVVGAGWCTLRLKVMGSYWYDGQWQRDFGRAWTLTFISGLATTCLGIGIAWKMGVDIWRGG